jgi:hypothetical protein
MLSQQGIGELRTIICQSFADVERAMFNGIL